VTAGWLALAAALAFLPSLAGSFQFDDFNVIVHEPAVHSWRAFLEHATGVRPLLKASYTLSWTLGGGAPGFHLFNIAVHAANTVLVYAVGREMCHRWFADPLTRESRADFASGGFSGAGKPPARLPLRGGLTAPLSGGQNQAAVLAALLFALHPVQVEAVTYISGRSSSLMALFYLGSVLAYLRGGHWALSGLLFALAAATKETALTLPAALALCELCSPKPQFRRQAAHWAILAMALAFVLLNPHYRELATFGFTQRGVGENLVTQAGGLSYLAARVLGVLGPNIDPALPAGVAWTPASVVQASLLLLLLGLGIAQLRRRPWIGFGVLWFFLQLAPTNSLIPRLDVANDRQLYLAGWGLFLALAVQLGTLPRIRLAFAALAVACLGASVARQLDYSSEIALWESDLRRAPWNARAHNNLGYAYQQAGRTDDARRAYRAALLFDPRHVRAQANLQLLKPE
jgi:hypothetical protein